MRGGRQGSRRRAEDAEARHREHLELSGQRLRGIISRGTTCVDALLAELWKAGVILCCEAAM